MTYVAQAHVAFGDMWTAASENQSLDNDAYLKTQADLQTFDGWFGADTWVYVGATSFKITGVNVTAKYAKGTELKCTDGGSTKYFYVIGSSFSTDTTVTIFGGSDYSLSGGSITNPYLSYSENPQGFPDWFNFTPSYGGGGMTYGTVTTQFARFRITRHTCTVQVVTTAGTIGGTPIVPLQVATTGTGKPPQPAYGVIYSGPVVGCRVYNNAAYALGVCQVDNANSTLWVELATNAAWTAGTAFFSGTWIYEF
jgi:hypothetical protein